MIREIKFRAWDEINKKMIYNFILHSSGAWQDKYSECQESFCGCQEYGIQRELTINKNNIMQFTGLKDKNGKEIYEEDIVKIISKGNDVLNGIGQVIYDDDESGYKIKKKYWYPKINDVSLIIEIIGNIYENPELLER